MLHHPAQEPCRSRIDLDLIEYLPRCREGHHSVCCFDTRDLTPTDAEDAVTESSGNEDAGAYDNRDRAQGIIDDPYGGETEHDRSADSDWIDARGLEKSGPREQERDGQKVPRPPLEGRSVEPHPHTHR